MNNDVLCIGGVCIDSATLQSAIKKIQSFETVNCEWNNWSNWSPCTKPCRGGTQVRNRTILQENENNGEPCIGPAEEVHVCNTEECPIDCTWGEWSPWNSCFNSKNCGIGIELEKEAVLFPNMVVNHVLEIHKKKNHVLYKNVPLIVL